ncbi:hypothetical protein [Bernardetia sp.]|uniref:hypothetical protein n=1 Tax=Bernardetia sp. TaxID=1937974 RepID=UPI0025C60489|nr:hypothetical protein [Bernardetia sp.]
MILEQKNRVLALLEKVNEEKIFTFLENFLQNFLQENSVLRYAKPLKEKLNIQELIQKQNYKTENVLALSGVLADDDEPFEELLEAL